MEFDIVIIISVPGQDYYTQYAGLGTINSSPAPILFYLVGGVQLTQVIN